MDGADSVFELMRLVRAFYWIMVDVLEVLEAAGGRAAPGLRFHLDLAGKRVKIILEHLKTAIEEAGLSLGEKMSGEELRRVAGSISIDILRDLREVVKGFVECRTSGSQAPLLASRLMDFAGVMNIAAGILRICTQNLRGELDKHAFKACLALEAAAQDLELMAQIHCQLASNHQMLAEDLEKLA